MTTRVTIAVRDHELDPPVGTTLEVLDTEADAVIIRWRGVRWPMLIEHVAPDRSMVIVGRCEARFIYKALVSAGRTSYLRSDCEAAQAMLLHHCADWRFDEDGRLMDDAANEGP